MIPLNLDLYKLSGWIQVLDISYVLCTKIHLLSNVNVSEMFIPTSYQEIVLYMKQRPHNVCLLEIRTLPPRSVLYLVGVCGGGQFFPHCVLVNLHGSCWGKGVRKKTKGGEERRSDSLIDEVTSCLQAHLSMTLA